MANGYPGGDSGEPTQEYMPPPELHKVPVSQPGKQYKPRLDYDEGKRLTRYNTIQVLEPGGHGGARVERLESHVDLLNEHIQGLLTVSG